MRESGILGESKPIDEKFLLIQSINTSIEDNGYFAFLRGNLGKINAKRLITKRNIIMIAEL